MKTGENIIAKDIESKKVQRKIQYGLLHCSYAKPGSRPKDLQTKYIKANILSWHQDLKYHNIGNCKH